MNQSYETCRIRIHREEKDCPCVTRMNGVFGTIKKLDFLESVGLDRNEIKSLDQKDGKTLKIR